MYRDEIVQVAQMVWESMLQLELAPMEQSSPPPSGGLIARVDISGAWRGFLVASCNEALARRMAGVLLQSKPELISSEHVRDALGEIVNMLGGSLKVLFPSPSKLSLPSIPPPGSIAGERAFEVLDRVSFDCGGDTFTIELRHSIAPAAAGADPL